MYARTLVGFQCEVRPIVPYTPLFFFLSARSVLGLMHTGKRTGVGVSHCISWFQTQLILTTCHIHSHSHLWDWAS